VRILRNETPIFAARMVPAWHGIAQESCSPTGNCSGRTLADWDVQ
jgi:hypothetical protein